MSSNESSKHSQEREQIQVTDSIKNPYVDPAVPMPNPGDKVGPNRIQVLIGEGGSANVYKVWHEGLEVVRAIKVLKRANQQEARERFLTEAKILADIHHPNIVEIHNIGYFDQQLPFMEMEFIDGTPVRQLIAQQGKLPLAVALSIAYFVCQALHYTHTREYTLYGKIYRGLIHRDIKPDNVVISKDGIVKLMDFGIARPSEVSLHTVGAKIMGTLVYLSPEQLNGKTLDHRSDIFSLGAVLYEMITGHRVFPQKTLSELVQKKNKGQYKPIDSFDIQMPLSLVNAVNKCLAIEPTERFTGASELGHELFKILREVSDRAPQDILTRYVRDPHSIQPWVPPKKNNYQLYAIAGSSGLAVLLLILLLFRC